MFQNKVVFASLFALVVTVTFSFVVSNPSYAEIASQVHGPPLGWVAHPPIHVKKAATTSPTGLAPNQILSAYGLDKLGCSNTGAWGDPTLCGSGQTIAIVDAYAYPSAENDLAVFDNQFNLPACTQSNHCLAIHSMAGKVRNNQGWALEEALDVQWAHAIAPGAKILLVQAKSSNLNDLFAAVDYAASQGAHQVSMSWGGSEFSSESSYDYHFQVSGVTFFASSGDSGSGVMYPAASPNVVSVGGTTLNVDALGNVNSEVAWSGSGGGVSSYELLPSYQSLYGIANSGRSVPDVSYDADPVTGMPVYDSYGYQGSAGWFQVGGTSAGSPQWASIGSIANTQMSTPMSSSDFGTENLFYGAASGTAYASNYRDIISGSNGGFQATTGYDLVTGVGSPLTNGLIPYISGSSSSPDFAISSSPSSMSIQQGGSDSSVISLTSLSGYDSQVTLSLSGNPSGVGYAFSANPVTPTSSSTLALNVDSTVSPGTYQLTVSGTDGTITHTTTISLTVTQPSVNVPLSVSVSTDKSSYALKSFVYITVNATDSSGSVSGASVVLTVTDPNNGSSQGSGTTDSNGIVMFKYKLSPHSPIGVYTASAQVSASGHDPGSNSVTFTVTK